MSSWGPLRWFPTVSSSQAGRKVDSYLLLQRRLCVFCIHLDFLVIDTDLHIEISGQWIQTARFTGIVFDYPRPPSSRYWVSGVSLNSSYVSQVEPSAPCRVKISRATAAIHRWINRTRITHQNGYFVRHPTTKKNA